MTWYTWAGWRYLGEWAGYTKPSVPHGSWNYITTHFRCISSVTEMSTKPHDRCKEYSHTTGTCDTNFADIETSRCRLSIQIFWEITVSLLPPNRQTTVHERWCPPHHHHLHRYQNRVQCFPQLPSHLHHQVFSSWVIYVVTEVAVLQSTVRNWEKCYDILRAVACNWSNRQSRSVVEEVVLFSYRIGL